MKIIINGITGILSKVEVVFDDARNRNMEFVGNVVCYFVTVVGCDNAIDTFTAKLTKEDFLEAMNQAVASCV